MFHNLKECPLDGRPLRTALVLDVETTGLSPYRDGVIELAIVLFQFGADGQVLKQSTREYVGLREPSRPISASAIRVHGITAGEVAGKRLERERIRTMVIEAEFCIAHNVRFDRPFVERLVLKLFAGKRWLCTSQDVDWGARGVA